ncbi:MAG: DUF1828 domain-containing protein [Methanomicrobia archaeon]|nr:DUF1828 domain-containing protein [Methanomicrobia archaeon]
MSFCDIIKKNTVDWFQEKIIIEDEGEKACRLIMPLMSGDGDLIEFTISEKSNGIIRISDEGETFAKLFTLGFEIEKSSKRLEIVKTLANTLEVNISEEEIFVLTKFEKLGDAVTRIISALYGINYLTYTIHPYTPPRFREMVDKFLVEEDIPHDDNVKIEGYAVEHTVDFVLSSGHFLLDALHAAHPYRASIVVDSAAVKSIDIKKKYEEKKETAVIYNDELDVWDTKRFDLLGTYVDHVIPWTQKGELIEILA